MYKPLFYLAICLQNYIYFAWLIIYQLFCDLIDCCDSMKNTRLKKGIHMKMENHKFTNVS